MESRLGVDLHLGYVTNDCDDPMYGDMEAHTGPDQATCESCIELRNEWKSWLDDEFKFPGEVED